MINEQEEIIKQLNSAQNTNKTVRTLLEDPESFNENKGSILLLLKKYREKLTNAIKVIEPDFEDNLLPERLIKSVMGNRGGVGLDSQADDLSLAPLPAGLLPEGGDVSVSASKVSAAISILGNLRPINYEYLPNPIVVKIARTLDPLTYSQDLQWVGPFQLIEDGIECSYRGEILNGKPHGAGRLVYKDGNIFEGTWVEGKLNGFGRVISWKGFYHEGQFKDGIAHGECLEKYIPTSIDKKPENAYSYQGKFFVILTDFFFFFSCLFYFFNFFDFLKFDFLLIML